MANMVVEHRGTSCAAAYSYFQLQEGHIRLIYLLPADDDEDLKCIFLTSDLKTSPPFEALSYVWGAPDFNVKLECGYGSVFITSNLAHALRSLRKRDESRLLWADQICINQQDLVERAAQVNFMGEIYSKAKQVVMWLGQNDEQAPKAPLAASFVKHLASLKKEVFLEYDLPTDEAMRARNLPPISAPEWDALNALISLPYFERVWILQEIRLAPAHLVLWADTELEWHEIQKAVLYVYHNERFHTGNQAVLDVEALDKVHAIAHEAKSLYELVQIAATRKATDERDKVFAMLGMIYAGNHSLRADYSKTLIEVFTEAAAYMVRETVNLKVLSHASDHNRTVSLHGDWPSWVPLWQPERIMALDSTSPRFRSDGGFPMHLVDTGPSNLLTVGGIHVATVAHHVQLLRFGPEDDLIDDLFARMLEAWKLCLNHAHVRSRQSPIIKEFLLAHVCGAFDWSQTAEDIKWQNQLYAEFAKFWTLMHYLKLEHGNLNVLENLEDNLEVADAAVIAMNGLASPAVVVGSVEFACAAKQFRDSVFEEFDWDAVGKQNLSTQIATIHRRLSSLGLSDRSLDRVTSNIFPFAAIEAAHMHFYYRYRDSAYWRRFFVADDGRFGMGPETMVAGDVVAILFGSKVPFVLRPKGNEFILLGDCYLEDVMEGQMVVDLQQRGQLETSIREITLV